MHAGAENNLAPTTQTLQPTRTEVVSKVGKTEWEWKGLGLAGRGSRLGGLSGRGSRFGGLARRERDSLDSLQSS